MPLPLPGPEVGNDGCVDDDTTDGDGLYRGEFAAEEEELLVMLRDVKDSLVLTRNSREGGGGNVLSLAFFETAVAAAAAAATLFKYRITSFIPRSFRPVGVT